jgi:hypothetical protein
VDTIFSSSLVLLGEGITRLGGERSSRDPATERAFGWPNGAAIANVGLPDSSGPRLPSSDLRGQLQATLSGSYTLERELGASSAAVQQDVHEDFKE